jgi:copper chaperone NosL
MFRPRWFLLIASLPLLLTLAACGGDKEVSLDPPDVKYNEDISEMGMFVVDPRFTVAWLPDEGEDWILFDDIGEMFKYRVVRFPDAEARVIWVNDYNDRQWLKAEDAWYVQTIEINSPMGWGVAAFRDEAAARQFQAEHGGEVMAWQDVLNANWEAPPAPEPHGHSTPDPAASPAHSGH